MDKKSLLAGMAIGGVIALSGMILGGQGAIQPMPGFQRIEKLSVGQLEVTEWASISQKLITPEINVVNAKGQTLIELVQRADLGRILLKDARGHDQVQISGILRGGGRIAIKENDITIAAMEPIGQGGRFAVWSQRDPAAAPGVAPGAAMLYATRQGGGIVLQDAQGNVVFEAPAPGAQGAAGAPAPGGNGAPAGQAPPAGAPGQDEPDDKQEGANPND